MASRKTLSIPMIAGIAIAGLVLLIGIAVVVVKSSAKPGPQQTTKRYAIKEQTSQPKIDPATEAAREAERTSRIAAQVGQQLRPQIDSLQASVRELQHRNAALESEQQRLVAVVGQRRPVLPRYYQERHLPDRYVTGASTMAVAGNRAWIVDGRGVERSIAAGDLIEPSTGTRRRAREVLPVEQAVITTSGELVAP